MTLVLGILLYRAWLAGVAPSEPAADEDASTAVAPRTAVRVKLTECRRVYGRTESTGYIENVGNVELHYVTVTSIWKNAQGQVIGTDTVYALQSDELAPGERRVFHDVTTLTTAQKCNAEPLDWW